MQAKIIHIDMDCFYAQVEMQDHPELKGRPVAVGGASDRRGVLCTANYEARKYGVRSAMPTAKAFMLCPELVLQPVNMPRYKAISAELRKIFFEYTDLVEPLSLDEAYLDVTACEKCENSATLIAKEIKAKILAQLGLTASAGVAPNKFLAKVASGWQKPNGLTVIPPDKIAEFVIDLPVEQLWGVGKVTADKLHLMGLKTCRDLQALSKEVLIEKFGKTGQQMYYYCRGEDNREVNPNRIPKSVSVETTFSEDLLGIEACFEPLPGLLDSLLKRLVTKPDLPFSKQFVKVKFNDFSQTTLERPFTKLTVAAYKKLLVLALERKSLPVRLLGIGVGFGLKDSPGEVSQGELF